MKQSRRNAHPPGYVIFTNMSSLFEKIMIDDIDMPVMPDISQKVLSMLDDGIKNELGLVK